MYKRQQLYFFRGIVHGASGLTYKTKQEPQAHTLEPQLHQHGYNHQPVQHPIRRQGHTVNREIAQSTQRGSDKDHLLHRYGSELLPTDKGCRELEQLKEKVERKIEEMEAGYDRLIELDPENEKRYLEKKREVVDIAIAAHAQLLPAIAHCQKPVRANRITHEDRDPQIRIREGLKPDRLG